MLFAIVSVLLVGAPVDPAPDTMRQELIRHTERLRATIQELQVSVENGYIKNLDAPGVGMIVDSDHDRGADGLYAAWILGVYKSGPADLAGIKPGDRLLSVNERTIENETKDVIYSLLSGPQGTVHVRVRRDDSVFTFIIARAPLPCLRHAVASLDKNETLAVLNHLQQSIDFLARQLEDRDAPQEKLSAIALVIARQWELVGNMSIPLLMYKVRAHDAVLESCAAQF